jgi:hypothetical protein
VTANAFIRPRPADERHLAAIARHRVPRRERLVQRHAQALPRKPEAVPGAQLVVELGERATAPVE